MDRLKGKIILISGGARVVIGDVLEAEGRALAEVAGLVATAFRLR
ncbi:MAG: hypothetical protein ACJ8AW_18040 [Rhodopila sp.]